MSVAQTVTCTEGLHLSGSEGNFIQQGTSFDMLDSVLAHDPWDQMNDTQIAFVQSL